MRRVAVVGTGMVSALGASVPISWRAAVDGQCGIRPISHFSTEGLRTKLAGVAADFDSSALPGRLLSRHERFVHLGFAAAQEAANEARWDAVHIVPQRGGVFMGSGLGGLYMTERNLHLVQNGLRQTPPHAVPAVTPNALAGEIAIHFQLRGANLTYATACSSAAHAIGQAFHAVRSGQLDMAFAGGAEAPLTPLTVAGFCNLRATSTQNDDPFRACRPFDLNRDGTILAEGAGVLVLEEMAHAMARGVEVLAEIRGYGSSCDAHHMVLPEESGESAADAIRGALQDAGIPAEFVDAISAHGTATWAGDLMETRAIKAGLSERAYQVPVMATKCMTGHALGASAAIQAVLAVCSLRQQTLLPTINWEHMDPQCDLDYIHGAVRPASIRNLLLNSFGFGGNNVSLVLSKVSDLPGWNNLD